MPYPARTTLIVNTVRINVPPCPLSNRLRNSNHSSRDDTHSQATLIAARFCPDPATIAPEETR